MMLYPATEIVLLTADCSGKATMVVDDEGTWVFANA